MNFKFTNLSNFEAILILWAMFFSFNSSENVKVKQVNFVRKVIELLAGNSEVVGYKMWVQIHQLVYN